jgi:hypothetical protein
MTVNVGAPFIGDGARRADPADWHSNMAISVHSTMSTTVGRNVQIKIGRT